MQYSSLKYINILSEFCVNDLYTMSFKDFRKANNLSQKEICDYLGVSKAYISQCESGISRLSSEKLSKLKENPYNWDTSMLTEPTTQHFTANASGNASASVNYNEKQSEESAVLRVRIESLEEQVSQLKDMLEREQALSQKYWEMIEKLTTK